MTVTETLLRLRRCLESSINLAFYAYVSGDNEAAMGVIDVERIIDEAAYQLIEHVSIAVGRSVEEAAKTIPLYTYVFAVDKVMDALKDLASLVLRGYVLSRDMASRLAASMEEPIAKLPGDRLAGSTVGELLSSYGVDVVAVKRGEEWILDPAGGLVIEPGDTVYVKGAREAVELLLQRLGLPGLGGARGGGLFRDIALFASMLPIMNELAHYQLRAQDPELAEEILEIEMYMDKLREQLSVRIIESEMYPVDKFLLTTLVTRIEDISDALTYIIVMPAQEEFKEILSALIESGDDRVVLLRAEKRLKLSDLVDTLEQLGVRILAVKRGEEWIAAVPQTVRNTVLEPGDYVLAEYEKPVERKVWPLFERLGLRRPRPGGG